MNEDPDDDAPGGPVCQWCHGTGVVGAAQAYVSGPNPFSGEVETMGVSRQCRHCRGSGRYDSAQDPTLDQVRGRPERS